MSVDEFGYTALEDSPREDEVMAPPRKRTNLWYGVAVTVCALWFVSQYVSRHQGSLVESVSDLKITAKATDSSSDKNSDWDYKNIPKSISSSACDAANYRDVSLKMAYENTYFGLLKRTWSQSKFEASDVRVLGDDIYVVCDSSWGLGKFSRALLPFAGEEIWPSQGVGSEFESQWEALVWDDRRSVFLAIQEAIPVIEHRDAIRAATDKAAAKLREQGLEGKDVEDKVRKDEEKELAARIHEVTQKDHYHGAVHELRLRRDGKYDQLRVCNTEFAFPFGNKGFEGAVGLRGVDGTFYMLALCEGNFCDGSKKGREAGNGRLVLMKLNETLKHKDGSAKCRWDTVRLIKIPQTAMFQDYSAVAVRKRRVLVSSQEASALYSGHFIAGMNEQGLVTDPMALEIGGDEEAVLAFPRGPDCVVEYCNIEGIDFLNDLMIVAVSDRMKGEGRQSYRCLAKDQSIHIFQLPF